MATQIIKMVIQFRRDTTENWNLNKDIVPAAGEPCFDLDQNTLKIGDGKTTYENLKPIGGVTISTDGKSVVFKDGALQLAGFDAAEVGAHPRKASDGTLEWVVPSTEVIDKLQSDVDSLKISVSTLQEIVTPSGEDAVPLLSRVEILEEKMDGTGKDSIDAKIDKKINEFANTISDDGMVNTLKELIDYVGSHGGEVETLVADINKLQILVGDIPVSDQINNAINSSDHITKTEAESTFISKIEAHSALKRIKYEISHKPIGTLVDYRDKEIRVMCPVDTQWIKQTVGGSGNPNMYYMGFKAYAPDGAVSFKEGDRGVIVDKMFTFDDDFAGIDEFGRKYSICWLALASYDVDSDTWTYFGKNSSVNKYVGWTYVVEWYDADGIIIESDSIRINLSNEDCHNVIEPYYMANTIKGVKVNGTLLDVIDGVVNIEVAEQTLGVKGSDEIDVAKDGTLSIKTVSFSKITQEEDTVIVMDGGSAI